MAQRAVPLAPLLARLTAPLSTEERAALAEASRQPETFAALLQKALLEDPVTTSLSEVDALLQDMLDPDLDQIEQQLRGQLVAEGLDPDETLGRAARNVQQAQERPALTDAELELAAAWVLERS